MKTIIWVVMVAPLLLGGCGLARDARVADARKQFNAAVSDCVARYTKSLAQRADCRAQAANTYIRPFYPHGDLMTLLQAQRKALAIKVDRGQLSREDHDVQIAQAESAIRQEELRRNNAERGVSAQEAASTAQILGASANLLRASQPPIPAPAVTTTCSRTGNFVNCTSQ